MLRTEVLEPSRHRTVVLRFFRILLATKRKALFSTALLEMVRFFLSRNDFEDARHTLAEYSRVPRFAASASLIASLQGLVDFTEWEMITCKKTESEEELNSGRGNMDTSGDEMASKFTRGQKTSTEMGLLVTSNDPHHSITGSPFLEDDDDTDSDEDFMSMRSRTAPAISMMTEMDSATMLRESAIRFFLLSFRNNPNGLDASHLVHVRIACSISPTFAAAAGFMWRETPHIIIP